MIDRILNILAYAMIVLGCIHLFFAFPVSSITLDWIWFVGSGFLIIFAGFLNFSALYILNHGGKSYFAVFANSMMALLFGLSLIVLQEPQVYFGAGLFLVASILSLLSTRSRNFPS
jgi:hypothetical protein